VSTTCSRAKDPAVFARLCEAYADIRRIDEAASALSSGGAHTSKDATAHAKLTMRYVWNWELGGLADADIAEKHGEFMNTRPANDQGMFARCWCKNDLSRGSAEDEVAARKG